MLAELKFPKWCVLLSCGVVLLILMLLTIHPFLATNQSVDGEILVVEGWLPDYALKQAVNEFHMGNYRWIVTTGGPLSGARESSSCSTYAQLGAQALMTFGIDQKVLIAVPAPHVKRNRTFTSALAFREWVSNLDLDVKAINLFSLDVHARKSYVLFKKTLEPRIKVGIIAAMTDEYDPRYWWLSIAGFKWVFRDFIGWIYAVFWHWEPGDTFAHGEALRAERMAEVRGQEAGTLGGEEVWKLGSYEAERRGGLEAGTL